MKNISLKEFALPLIKSIDSFNFLLKSHHRRVAIASYYLGKELKLDKYQMIDLILAASLHDIGALSIQERDMLIKEDVENPEPHCIMGYNMLSSSSIFANIAQIIKHHHIKYNKVNNIDDEILFQSHIIHLADRVDILISHDNFILNQKNEVIKKINNNKGIVFHPEVCEAFLQVSKADIFWMDINNMTMDELFNSIDFSIYHNLTMKQMVEFSLVFSKVIDFRSSFTASHSYTVGQLAYNIGKFLNFNNDKCTKLLIAGYFHDIGKIGINNFYIEKDGPLSEEEFNHIKFHPYFTKQILNELSISPWFKEIINWAVYHHEKVDGSGYPCGLKGNEVEKETMIIAYSDIISALTEDRPYRKSIPLENALDIIKTQVVPKLDEDIFNVIVAHKNEIETIIGKCHDFNKRS